MELNITEEFQSFLSDKEPKEEKIEKKETPVEELGNKYDQNENERKLSDFKVLFDLGDGSFANVCKVIHKTTKEVFARKTVSLEKGNLTPKSVVAEIKSLFDSECENIIQMKFCIVEENIFYMFLEYLNCGSLSDLKRIYGKIPEPMVSRLGKEILQGLDYLHSKRRIVHRDIKPGNILLHLEENGGKVKLCDFGLAGFKDSENLKILLKEKRKIRFNSFVGTNIYMSPERLKGKEHSFDCDIWSLGMVLLELAMGEFPVSISNTNDIFWQMLEKHRLLKEEIANGDYSFSKEFANFINLCLEIDPSKRPSAAELLKHPFIVKYEENGKFLFFGWIQKNYIPLLTEERKRKVEERKKRKKRKKVGFRPVSIHSSTTNKSFNVIIPPKEKEKEQERKKE